MTILTTLRPDKWCIRV